MTHCRHSRRRVDSTSPSDVDAFARATSARGLMLAGYGDMKTGRPGQVWRESSTGSRTSKAETGTRCVTDFGRKKARNGAGRVRSPTVRQNYIHSARGNGLGRSATRSVPQTLHRRAAHVSPLRRRYPCFSLASQAFYRIRQQQNRSSLRQRQRLSARRSQRGKHQRNRRALRFSR